MFLFWGKDDVEIWKVRLFILSVSKALMDKSIAPKLQFEEFDWKGSFSRKFSNYFPTKSSLEGKLVDLFNKKTQFSRRTNNLRKKRPENNFVVVVVVWCVLTQSTSDWEVDGLLRCWCFMTTRGQSYKICMEIKDKSYLFNSLMVFYLKLDHNW